MRTFRRGLASIAGVWLACQLVALTAVPLSVFREAAAAVDAAACTCSHRPDAQCPMHHTPATPPSDCRCSNNLPDAGSPSVVSLLGPAAVLPDAPLASIEPPAATSPDRSITRLTVWIAAPPGPPPRA